MRRVYVGTAGWAIPRSERDAFPNDGSGLERYATRFNAAEINSTFRQIHRPATLLRWGASVPSDFRFSVKIPKTISHDLKLTGTDALLQAFVSDLAGLGRRQGPILLQLPPSLVFDHATAEAFFQLFKRHSAQHLVCEARHPTWFGADAAELMTDYSVARVAAHPPRTDEDGRPAGYRSVSYYRLHGSPRPYYSAYDEAFLMTLSSVLREDPSPEIWCIFDNTASGAATRNAISLRALLASLEMRVDLQF